MVRPALVAVALALTGCATAGAPPSTPGTDEVRRVSGPPTPWRALVPSDRETLVVFATTWCTSCAEEWPAVRAWLDARPETGLAYVVSGSPAADVAALVSDRAGLAPDRTVVDEGGALARRYAVEATPTLFLVRAGGERLGPFSGLEGLRGALTVEVEDAGEELGTSYHVVLRVPPARAAEARAALDEARATVRALDAELSEWRADGQLRALDTRGHAGVEVTPTLVTLLQGALHIAEATGGAFDPTWRTYSALWAEAAADDAWPSDAALATARAAAGPARIEIDGRRVRLTHPDTRLGIAGLAKGWVIDQVFTGLRKRGFEDVLVNIGGDARFAGPRRRFRIASPYRADTIAATLWVDETALATSGNYLRKRTIGGRRVGHILDPRTGTPPAFDGSVTVLTRDATMADALATALFVMGPEAGLAFARAQAGLEAIYVTSEGVLDTRSAPR